jgi:hypothetical protein
VNISTNNLSAVNLSTIRLQTSELTAPNISSLAVTTSSVKLFSGTTAGYLSASANGNQLLFNNSAVGSWTPTALSDLNMANYNISNVANLTFNSLPSCNQATINYNGTSLQISCNVTMNADAYVNGIVRTNIIQANTLNYITFYNDFNMNNNNLYAINAL